MQNAQTLTSLYSFSLQELSEEFQGLGLPSYRTQQVIEWLYKHDVASFNEMTNLPMSLRDQLSQQYSLIQPKIVAVSSSTDGTKKYLLSFPDRNAVETVALPSNKNRLTACISSQVGCSMACAFCATGKTGFTRNLQPGEIVNQVQAIEKDFDQRVTNVVVMGQGEPFANYRNTINALKILNSSQCKNIGARHITISTCGIIPGINRLSQENEQYTLAISLHAAIQETRDLLMPKVREFTLPDLKSSLQNYVHKTNRRPSLEYALIKKVNDSKKHLDALIEFTRDLNCHVNLIPLNEVTGSDYIGSSRSVVNHFEHELNRSGTQTTIRKSRGDDIEAACGQLKNIY